MKSTLKDVARRAGVSIKTVSRVLNNEPNVIDKKRECVIAAASELRYTPNHAARSLRTSKTYHLALLYDNPSPSYIARMQRGAVNACDSRGYHLIIQPISIEDIRDPEEKRNIVRSVLDMLRVDGVILTPPLCDSETILQTLAQLDIPNVRVGSNLTVGKGVRVGMDDKQAAQQMTDYLISKGHTRIGFITGHAKHAATMQRLSGYMTSLKLAEIIVQEDLIVEGDFSFGSGVKAATKLLSRNVNERPTVIFASNDDMAAAVISTACHMGLSVPNDVSVCGFDDAPLAKILFPTLTTVQQPVFSIGQRAAKLLFDADTRNIQRSEPLLEYQLRIRNSVASLSNGRG